MRSIAERIPQRGGVLGEGIHILHFKSEVGEIGADEHGPAAVEFTNLDQFLAARSLEKNKLGSPPALAAAHLLQAEDLAVEVDRFVQIAHAIPSVKEFFNHFFEKSRNYCFLKNSAN